MLSRLQQRISEMTCIDPIHSLIFCFLFLQHHAPTLQGLACLLLPTCNCHFPPKNKVVRLSNFFFFSVCMVFFCFGLHASGMLEHCLSGDFV